MYCIYCGKKVVDHARYCNYCGQFIGNTIIDQSGFDPEDNMTVDVYAPVELLDEMEPFREIEDDRNLVFSYGPVPMGTDFNCDETSFISMQSTSNKESKKKKSIKNTFGFGSAPL